MTQNQSARRSLLVSALSLLACMSMLAGSTFAWFNQSITSGSNKISSGSLDMELWHSPNNSYPEYGFDESNCEQVSENTPLFLNIEKKPILWEPGATARETFRVKNTGSLAFNFAFRIKAVGTSQTQDQKKLTDILQMKIKEYENNAQGEPMEVSGGTDYQGSLAGDNGDGYIFKSTLLPGEVADYSISLDWIPSEKDNAYNVPNGLDVTFAIELVATQLSYESDSFDDQYDANAQ